MWLFLWDSEPSKIFVGDTPISKIFLWDTQVRPTWWGRLPSGYQEVEYIQSSWTQYFVIGSSFKTSYKSVIDLEMDVIWWDYIPLWCNKDSPFHRYWINAYNSHFNIVVWDSWAATATEDKNRHTITIDKGVATIDGTNYNVSYTNVTIPRWIWVFWYNQQTGGIGYMV